MGPVDDSQIYCKQLLCIPASADIIIKEAHCLGDGFPPLDIQTLSTFPGSCTYCQIWCQSQNGKSKLLSVRIFPVDGRIGKYFSNSAVVCSLLADEWIFLAENLKRERNLLLKFYCITLCQVQFCRRYCAQEYKTFSAEQLQVC